MKSVQKWVGGVAGSARVLVLIAVAVLVLMLPEGAVAANATKLSISCTPKQLSPGAAAVCVATVTDAGSVATREPPNGTVTFTVEGTGTFEPEGTCPLEPSGAFSSKCSVSYTPTEIAGGEHALLGTYDGDETHGRATARFVLEVTPANDEPDNATRLPIPAKMTGTTEGATWDWEDPELCSDSYAPVWYSVKPAQSGRIAVRLTVKGRVDSVVAVFRLDRSKLKQLGCELTDASGVAGVPFDAERGTSYLIAVAAPWDARVGGFTIETATVAPVKLPGAPLAHDAEVRLDPLLRPGIAFSLKLRQGITYRVNATAPAACLQVSLLRPSASSADDAIRKGTECSGYLVYTPGPGMDGAFPLVVSMPEGRAVSVHVSLRPAQADDLAPGLPLASGSLKHGRLAANAADVVDVYRFRTNSRGDATVQLRGQAPSDLLLLSNSGKQIACACDGDRSSTIVQRLDSGSYFAVVRGRPGAAGSYAISLRMRQPTSTAVRVTRAAANRKILSIVARVSPSAKAGRVVCEVEHFDPLSGWHFAHATTHRIAAGQGRFTISPTEGRWRVRARYAGSLSSSPSVSGWTEIISPAAK